MSKVEIEKKDHIGIIKLNNPKALNALNLEMFQLLNEAVDKLANDKDIYVLVISGEGKAFAAGADIKEMESLNSLGAIEWGLAGSSFMTRLENSKMPVIAAINGYALGGGCELALACDIRIASEKAKFALPEVGLGVIPGFGGTQRLPREIGLCRAKELIYTGKTIDAAEAERIGLINKVTSPEVLMDEALELAKAIASKAQIAVQQAKKAVMRGIESSIETGLSYESQAFGVCFSTEDQKIGMGAFIAKEKVVNFKNK